MRFANTVACVVGGVAGIVMAPRVDATDWLQFGYDVPHSSFNRAETGYSTAAGNTIAYHYALPADYGTADSAPIYVGSVATQSGTKNLLFVVTRNGYLVALDADTTTPSVVWAHQPKAPVTSPQITTGSPAVDSSRQYVYAYAHDGNIHKYQVADGTEITDGGWPEVSTLKPDIDDKGASGLSVATAHDGKTYLYSVTDGYVGDANDYQGHLTAIDLGSGTQKVFNSLCSGLTIHFVQNGTTSGPGQDDCASRRSGIWGRAGAVYDDGTDRVFVMTGNGPYDPAALNWGDSLLALNPDGSGSGGGMPVDSYTPTTFANLDAKDADFGSASIAILPAPPGTAAAFQHIAAAGGKDGCVRLINLADLSGAGAPAHVGGELQLQNFAGGGSCATGNNSSDIKPQPAVWVNPDDQSTWVYVATYSSGLAAYKVELDVDGRPSLAKQWPASGTASNGTSPIVANGTVYYMSGNKLRALDAVTGANKLSGGDWTTTSYGSQHWQSPIIVNGRVYLFDNANPSNLWVFQLDGAFKSGFE
jgi:hypothetical protein